MQLKPFEAGRYDDDTIVVSNRTNGKQELFTEAEFEIVKFLKRNENESLLALLLPNMGIAKKSHIVLCLQVVTKLKRMQIVDALAITGRKPVSDTSTLEMRVKRERIELYSLHSLAAVAFGIGNKVLPLLGSNGLLISTILIAALSFAFFPFQHISSSMLASQPSYVLMFLLAFSAGSMAMMLRGLLQAAYLKTLGCEIAEPTVAFIFPLLTLDADYRSVNLAGFRARLQKAMVGLLAPFALSAVFTILVYLDFMSAALGFVAFATCAGVTLVLACPFLSFDSAEILHVLFFRNELEEKVSARMIDLMRAKGSIGREMTYVVCASVVWLFVWLDCLRSFWEGISPTVVEDLSLSGGVRAVGAGMVLLCLAGFVALPVSLFVIHYFRGRSQLNKRRVVVQKGRVKDSLTFEERISALEKIPLFTYLNDQERLALLNEMQPAFYDHGQNLVHQGEVGREFFILVKGHANAFYADVKGKSYLLADLREGDAFGEIALIDDVPRTASIVSDGGCIVLMLNKDGFNRFAVSLGSPDRIKSMVRLTSFFRRHPLFSKLGPRDQAQLIDRFHFSTMTVGEQVTRNEDHFHVIYNGAIRVDMGDDSGDTTLFSDDCFGYSNPFGARFFAAEGTGLLSVSKENFHNLIWEKLVQRPELFV